MLIETFEKTIAGLERKLQSSSNSYIARKRYALEVSRYGLSLYSRKQPMSWTGVLAPFELLNAMGIRASCVEFIGALLSNTGAVGDFLEAAEQLGYSTDTCAYHRAVIGAMHADLMPEPDFLIGVSAPCTGGLAVIEDIAEHFKKDLFVIHVPHDHSLQSTDFVAQQLEEMVRFIEEHTSEKLTEEKLQAAVALANQGHALMLETMELAKAVPCPARPKDLSNIRIVLPMLSGQDGCLDVIKTFRDELKDKVEKGIAGVPGERFRLMWLQNRIQFPSPLEKLLAEEHQANIVVDELNQVNCVPIDPKEPFRGFAERIMSICLVGPLERRIENILRLAREYRVDGVVHPCHWGCRQGTGARGLFTSALKEADLPLLNLEVDCIDTRNFSEGQVRTRIDAFMEMLSNRA